MANKKEFLPDKLAKAKCRVAGVERIIEGIKDYRFARIQGIVRVFSYQ